MPQIPYIKQGAPFIDHPSSADATFAAADANAIETGIYDAHFMPAVRVTHNAAQSINTATATILAFNTEQFDQAGGAASTQHDTSTNNSRLVCRYAGVYLVQASILWGANATGYRSMAIRLNGGGTFLASDLFFPGSASSPAQHGCSSIYQLAVSDYVEVQVDHTAGVALDVMTTSPYSPQFSMVRVA